MELYVGLGCRKNIPFEDLLSALKKVIIKYDLNIEDIKILSSIDIKQCEPAFVKLSKVLNRKLIFYSAEELQEINAPNKSEFVNKVTGTYSVSESSAILSSLYGKLIVPKQKFNNLTIAIAE